MSLPLTLEAPRAANILSLICTQLIEYTNEHHDPDGSGSRVLHELISVCTLQEHALRASIAAHHEGVYGSFADTEDELWALKKTPTPAGEKLREGGFGDEPTVRYPQVTPTESSRQALRAALGALSLPEDVLALAIAAASKYGASVGRHAVSETLCQMADAGGQVERDFCELEGNS